jgi:alkaline phosphatase D
MTNTPSNRREFLIKVGSVAASVAAGGSLSGCGTDEGWIPLFDYGVASGDPLATSVVLWTHARPSDASSVSVPLTWEVSSDAAFQSIVASGQVVADASTGHTAKVDATGLRAGTEYWYRFRQGSFRSPVGRTRTLPEAGVSQIKLAVFSCSNYPAGRFHAYSDAATRGAQVALHLGDYIYEYAATGYASSQAAAMGRQSIPAGELLTLDDYRKRHAQYKSDPDSKVLHSAMPMIAVWDDHETANDSWREGAENHDPATEGTWQARRAAALQAYHEWMPIRTGSSRESIYRGFDFGDLVSLHMLDTRLIGRDKQVEFTELLNPATQAAATQTLSSPTRQILGAAQTTWLQGRLATSPGKWQILGQQVLMARMEFPVSVLQALNPSDTSPAAQAAGQAAINDYLTAKGKKAAGAPLTQAETDLLDPTKNPKLGYNLDAWDGYPAAREVLLNTVAQAFAGRDRKLVSLAGDTHNAWYSQITAAGFAAAQGGLAANALVGVELATPGVTSPGLESYLTIPPAQTEQIFRGVVDDLRWMDASQRGYLMLTISRAEIQADWVFVSDVTKSTFTAAVGNSVKLT